MQVMNSLPPILAGVDHEPVSRLGKTQFPSHPDRKGEDGCQIGLPSGAVDQRGRCGGVPRGNDQDVDGGLRVEVVEGHGMAVPGDLTRRNIPGDDPAERAIRMVGQPSLR